MELLALHPNRSSLEFAATEWPAISARLQEFGIVVKEQLTTIDLVKVGAESFILSDDGVDVALISQTVKGDQILKRVARGIGVGFSASTLRRSFRNRRNQGPVFARHAA